MKIIHITFWDDRVITVDYPFMVRYTVDNVNDLYDLLRFEAHYGFDYSIIRHFPTDSNWLNWIR